MNEVGLSCLGAQKDYSALSGEGLQSVATLDALASRLAHCRRCDTMYPGVVPVAGDGAARADFFLIGEAPGRLGADVTGVPFTRDRTGRFLRQVLRQAGLEPTACYITNLVKCNPRSRGKNRRPTAQEIEKCERFWRAELHIVRPKIIVPLGKLATEHVLGRPGLSISRWHRRCSCAGGFVVVPFFHPSYVVNRHGYPEEAYKKDFEWLARLLASEMRRGPLWVRTFSTGSGSSTREDPLIPLVDLAGCCQEDELEDAGGWQ